MSGRVGLQAPFPPGGGSKGSAFLSIRTGPWSFSLAVHVGFLIGLLFLGRNRTIDLTFLDLGNPQAAAPSAVSQSTQPEEDIWRFPETRRRPLSVPKPVPAPEPPQPEVPAQTGTGFGSGGPYRSVAQVTQLPRFVSQQEASYPEEAKRANVEGLVILQVEIDAQGLVQSVEVVKGMGYGCDEAAVAAVNQSTFSPAMVGSEPVPVRIRIPYRFKFEY